MKATLVFAFSASGSVAIDIREDGFDVVTGEQSPLGMHGQLVVADGGTFQNDEATHQVLTAVIVRALEHYSRALDRTLKGKLEPTMGGTQAPGDA